MGLPSCDNTPPIAWPLASVVTMKDLEKSGRERTGALLRVSLRILKASLAAGVHTKTLAFLRVVVIGEAIRA